MKSKKRLKKLLREVLEILILLLLMLLSPVLLLGLNKYGTSVESNGMADMKDKESNENKESENDGPVSDNLMSIQNEVNKIESLIFNLNQEILSSDLSKISKHDVERDNKQPDDIECDNKQPGDVECNSSKIDDIECNSSKLNSAGSNNKNNQRITDTNILLPPRSNTLQQNIPIPSHNIKDLLDEIDLKAKADKQILADLKLKSKANRENIETLNSLNQSDTLNGELLRREKVFHPANDLFAQPMSPKAEPYKPIEKKTKSPIFDVVTPSLNRTEKQSNKELITRVPIKDFNLEKSKLEFVPMANKIKSGQVVETDYIPVKSKSIRKPVVRKPYVLPDFQIIPENKNIEKIVNENPLPTIPKPVQKMINKNFSENIINEKMIDEKIVSDSSLPSIPRPTEIRYEKLVNEKMITEKIVNDRELPSIPKPTENIVNENMIDDNPLPTNSNVHKSSFSNSSFKSPDQKLKFIDDNFTYEKFLENPVKCIKALEINNIFKVDTMPSIVKSYLENKLKIDQGFFKNSINRLLPVNQSDVEKAFRKWKSTIKKTIERGEEQIQETRIDLFGKKVNNLFEDLLTLNFTENNPRNGNTEHTGNSKNDVDIKQELPYNYEYSRSR